MHLILIEGLLKLQREVIKISHPLPSTSACSLAAVWCSIAMEALLLSTQRKQNNRYWLHFLCFALSLFPQALISPPYSISLGPCQLYHIVFLTSSPHILWLSSFPSTSLSPISYYMVLPHSLCVCISCIPERKRNWGETYMQALACVYPLQVGEVTNSQSRQVSRQARPTHLLSCLCG